MAFIFIPPVNASATLVRNQSRQLGFTLLELLVVVAIIGLLAAFAGPRVFGHVKKSEITTARAQIQALSRAIEAYRLDVGRYPDSTEGLGGLMTAPADAGRLWNGPYLEKAPPLDPWGGAYLYRSPAGNRDFEVVSLGKDRTPGGIDENADLTN